MANTSSTGGYLTPDAAPAPLEDDDLFNFFQEWFVGLSGLPPTMVRPAWQPTDVPNIPEQNVNWVALRITAGEADTFAVGLHYSAPVSYNELRRHEQLEILVSCYGPNCGKYLGIIRDGMQIAQNREVLALNNFGLVASSKSFNVPEMVKAVWYQRKDFRVWINRQIVRTYGIQDIASAHGFLNNEKYIEVINVTENTP